MAAARRPFRGLLTLLLLLLTFLPLLLLLRASLKIRRIPTIDYVMLGTCIDYLMKK